MHVYIYKNSDLVTAALNGDMQAVQKLLAGGANVNSQNKVIKLSNNNCQKELESES